MATEQKIKNELKIKIKLFHNSASYLVNEELIDLQTTKVMHYFPVQLLPVQKVDTHVCSNIDNSIQDIPSVPIVDTPACNNNNNNI